jgi:hypothetical protein
MSRRKCREDWENRNDGTAQRRKMKHASSIFEIIDSVHLPETAARTAARI